MISDPTQLELILEDSLTDLTEYSVKVSKRARSVSFQVLPLTGLLVTIPSRFPRREIPELILSNRDWIEKQIKRVAQTTDPEFLLWPPAVLRIRCIGVDLAVRFCNSEDDTRISGHILGDVLTVYGGGTDGWVATARGRSAFLRLLAKLLKAEAKRLLEPQTHRLAEANGLSFKRLNIRGQRTLWGSYSSSGTLSLNYKLLFLPPEYARYIILHELAHTRYLDHSAKFWRFLASMEPDARRLDKELNEVGRLVPPWL